MRWLVDGWLIIALSFWGMRRIDRGGWDAWLNRDDWWGWRADW
jgi:hypothetical protein